MSAKIRSTVGHTQGVQLYAGSMLGNKTYSDRPKTPLKKVNNANYRKSYETQPVLFWGEDNLFPQHLLEAAAKCGILLQGLNRLVEATINQGIFTYKILEETDNELIIKQVKYQKFEDFKKLNKLETHFLAPVAADYWKYGDFFPIFKLNKDRSEIAQLTSYRSKDCRKGKQNPETGIIDTLYVSGQWPTNPRNLISSSGIADEDKNWVLKFNMVDEWDTAETMRSRKSIFDFAQSIKHPCSEFEYGTQPWHAVYHNKWLNISSSVPEMKEKLFMYAMTINYMIGIEDSYFTTVFGDEFENWSKDEQVEKIKELQASIEKNLVGKDNAFKTLFYEFKYDNSGTVNKSIILDVIDNKLREGTHVVDNLQANAEIATALGVSPSLLGTSAMGEKSSTGSGSNIREALLELSSKIRLHRDLILDPLNTVRDYNDWDPDLRFGFKDYILNTQDGRQVDTGKQVIIK